MPEPRQELSEPARARWYELRLRVKEGRQTVSEWLTAVLEIKNDRLWRFEHQTWQDYCDKDLGRTAGAIRALISRENAQRTDRALPPSLKDADFQQRIAYAEGQGRALKGSLKRFRRMMDEWPSDDLSREKAHQLTKQLEDWLFEYEMWLAENGVTVDIARVLAPKADPSKAKRKKNAR